LKLIVSIPLVEVKIPVDPVITLQRQSALGKLRDTAAEQTVPALTYATVQVVRLLLSSLVS
jgi:hypothetical protein